jgi:hypothetical protein
LKTVPSIIEVTLISDPVAASASEPINSEWTDHHSLALAATGQIKV